MRVEEETVGEIGRGLLVLAGIEKGDGMEKVRAAAEKLAGLRNARRHDWRGPALTRPASGGVKRQ